VEVSLFALVAAVVAGGMLPRVYLALLAMNDFGTYAPNGPMFVSLYPVGWVRAAFGAVHVCMSWCLWMVREGSAGRAVKGAGLILGIELAIVYLITGYLWWRGIPLALY
jgi:hypothetical protein